MPLFTPIGGGGIGKATVTATTGSPTIDTASRAGKTIYKFTGSGTITIGNPGTAEVLVIGAGGGGGGSYACGSGAGGAGGYIYNTVQLLPSGTLTVTIGAGGIGGIQNGYHGRAGNSSQLGNRAAIGGGVTGHASRV